MCFGIWCGAGVGAEVGGEKKGNSIILLRCLLIII